MNLARPAARVRTTRSRVSGVRRRSSTDRHSAAARSFGRERRVDGQWCRGTVRPAPTDVDVDDELRGAASAEPLDREDDDQGTGICFDEERRNSCFAERCDERPSRDDRGTPQGGGVPGTRRREVDGKHGAPPGGCALHAARLRPLAQRSAPSVDRFRRGGASTAHDGEREPHSHPRGVARAASDGVSRCGRRHRRARAWRASRARTS
jgi:hypothetical protein